MPQTIRDLAQSLGILEARLLKLLAKAPEEWKAESAIAQEHGPEMSAAIDDLASKNLVERERKPDQGGGAVFQALGALTGRFRVTRKGLAARWEYKATKYLTAKERWGNRIWSFVIGVAVGIGTGYALFALRWK